MILECRLNVSIYMYTTLMEGSGQVLNWDLNQDHTTENVEITYFFIYIYIYIIAYFSYSVCWSPYLSCPTDTAIGADPVSKQCRHHILVQ